MRYVLDPTDPENVQLASDHCRDCPDWGLCAKCRLEVEIDARAEELLEERDRTATQPGRRFVEDLREAGL